MSTTTSYGRSRSGDRFYNPPAVRRQLQLQQQQQQQQQVKQESEERERTPAVTTGGGGGEVRKERAIKNHQNNNNNNNHYHHYNQNNHYHHYNQNQNNQYHYQKEREREREEEGVRRERVVQQKKQKAVARREKEKERGKEREREAISASGGAGGGGVVAVVAAESRGESDDCASTATATTGNNNVVASASVSVSSNSSVSMVSNNVSMSNAAAAFGSGSNLDRFLEFTTPSVPAQCFSKTSMKGWRTQEEEFRSFFVLGDLWESFKEWSAYGAGVPLLLNGSDSVVQYYVPYLSGMQLYRDPSKPLLVTRRPGEESDESSRETCSDGSSDGEIDKGTGSLSKWSQQDLSEGMNGLSIGNKPLSGSSSEDGESPSSPGDILFQYFEYDPPYLREPLADKVSLLAKDCPELKSYRSCDLLPSSWISVAWYPIYRIPTGPTLQNLDSCFLTFHSLSTPIRGAQNEWQCHFGSCPREVLNGFDLPAKLSLPIFAMASYKFKISVWDHNGVDECPKVNALQRAAEEWLRLLNVNHPDYGFFVSRNYCR